MILYVHLFLVKLMMGAVRGAEELHFPLAAHPHLLYSTAEALRW